MPKKPSKKPKTVMCMCGHTRRIHHTLGCQNFTDVSGYGHYSACSCKSFRPLTTTKHRRGDGKKG